MEPQELKVVVYAGRNLQSKRDDGPCSASVEFGVGKEKFRTRDIVKKNNPTWNVYSVIKIVRAAPLVITVFDQDEVLGTITIPLAQVPSSDEHRYVWMPLASKNAPSNGDLCFDCWVVSFKESAKTRTSAFKLSSFLPSFLAKDRSKRRESIEAASTSMKGSHSTENLYTDPGIRSLNTIDSGTSLKRTDSGQIPRPLPLSQGNAPPLPPLSSLNFRPRLRPTSGQTMSGNCPEITDVAPTSGSASGGTRVTLLGTNLGKSKDDILSLSVNDSDVRGSLVRHSSAKVVLSTKPWEGSGPVAMVTKSGGKGVSMVSFTFVKEEKVPREELLKEITRRQNKIDELTDENKALRRENDWLLVPVMTNFPEALEHSIP